MNPRWGPAPSLWGRPFPPTSVAKNISLPPALRCPSLFLPGFGRPFSSRKTKSQQRRPESLPLPDPARRRGPSPPAQPPPLATHAMPEAPESPIMLVNTTTRAGPGSPATPAAGVTAATPVTPALLVAPETPATPSAPATAAIPEVAASPVMPAAPVTPASPGIPASPMTP